MTLQTIALRNVMRRKGKAAFVCAGLVIGVAAIVTVNTTMRSMTGNIHDNLEKYGANIVIVPKTEHLLLTYGGVSLGDVSFDTQEIHQAELARINTIENAANIAAVGPIALGVVSVADRPVMMAGIDMDTAYILKPWWRVNGDLPVEYQVVAGAESARVLNLAIGDRLTMNGRDVHVAGILEPTGAQDDQLLFATLATAQTLMGKEGKVSMVEVAALCKDCPIEEIMRQISAELPTANVMAIQQVVKSRMQALRQFHKFSYGMSAIVLFVGSLVVLVTMMSSVRERTEEIGIFRAIGFRRRHVMHIIMLEAVMISLLAGIGGYGVGLGVTALIVRVFTEATAVLAFDLELAGSAMGLAVLTGMLASAYPALMAARLDPNDALRAL
jgi:putative ABC transport system permease protein